MLIYSTQTDYIISQLPALVNSQKERLQMTVKDGYSIEGVTTVPVYKILEILGGLSYTGGHYVELLEAETKQPPEDFTECGHPTAGALADVYKFALSAKNSLKCCSIDSYQSGDGCTHWIIGCYYPTGFESYFVIRNRPYKNKCGALMGFKWHHMEWKTNDKTGIKFDCGNWIIKRIYPLKGEKQH